VRKLYWYLSSYVRKHGLVVIATLVAGIIGFSFVIPFIVRSIEQKPRLYIGVVGDYSLTNLPPPVKKLMSSGLTTMAEDGSPLPDLSERWNVEADGKVYRFIVKKNVFWQDGKSIEPADIQYNFQGVEVVYTPNDVVFKLPDAFVPFPLAVSEPIFRSSQKKVMFFFTKPFLIGTGAYELLDYKQKGPRLTEMTIDGVQDRRMYRFFLTEDDAILAFKRGEVDIIEDLSSPRDLAGWTTVETAKVTDFNRYLAVFFNQENPLFQKNIRQALSYALPKPSDNTRAIGPISPNSWAYLDSAKSYDFDQPRAVERLLSEMPAEKLIFELTTIPIYQAEAETIKQHWETLGRLAYEECQKNKAITDKATCDRVLIAVNLRVTSFPDTNNFQMLLLGQESPPDPDQYYLWHSDQSTNFSRYKNTRIDSLLEKGRKTPDRNERLAVYQEFQQFFLEDAPAIFLRHLDTYTVKRK
jgi:peptide/nickel transport system substrate-binding protein